jgi:NADH:ubiquinone oxidoreductase subunit 6 (subunit J)
MPPRRKRTATTRLALLVTLLLFANVFVLTLLASDRTNPVAWIAGAVVGTLAAAFGYLQVLPELEKRKVPVAHPILAAALMLTLGIQLILLWQTTPTPETASTDITASETDRTSSTSFVRATGRASASTMTALIASFYEQESISMTLTVNPDAFTPTYTNTPNETDLTVTAIIARATWQEVVNRTLTVDPNAFTPTDTPTASATLPPLTGTAHSVTLTALHTEGILMVTAIIAEATALEALRLNRIQTANAPLRTPTPQAFATTPS